MKLQTRGFHIVGNLEERKSLPVLGWFITTTSSRKVASLWNRVYVYCYYLLTLFISYKVNSGSTGSFLYFSCCTSSTHRRVSSVQFSHSVVCDSLQPHGLQHARLPCPSPNSQSLLKLMSVELVMSSNHLILCRPLLLLPSIFPSIRIFSNELVLGIRWPKYWSFSFSISPSNLISFRMDWFDLLTVQGTLKSLLQKHNSKASILQCSALWSSLHQYMTTGKPLLAKWCLCSLKCCLGLP